MTFNFWSKYVKAAYYSKVTNPHNLRMGQFMFNKLHEVNPKLAKLVNKSHVDPFNTPYEEFSSYREFFEFVEDHWDDENELAIKYTCPRCEHEWEEQWSCACNSECPECGLSDIEAESWY